MVGVKHDGKKDMKQQLQTRRVYKYIYILYTYIYISDVQVDKCLFASRQDVKNNRKTHHVGGENLLDVFCGAAVCSVKNASACIFRRFTPASLFLYSPYMEYSAYICHKLMVYKCIVCIVKYTIL